MEFEFCDGCFFVGIYYLSGMVINTWTRQFTEERVSLGTDSSGRVESVLAGRHSSRPDPEACHLNCKHETERENLK